MTRVLYRIAAVLIVLFALGHSSGFPWSDPEWGVDLRAVQSTHFDILGFTRTYWDFYLGFGLFVGVLLLLAALFAWQLGNLPAQMLWVMRRTAWGVALGFAAVTLLSYRYFFIVPFAFSGVITICLTLAAWRATQGKNPAGGGA